MDQEKGIAKKIVEKEFKKRNIKIEKIILFGSRARGDSKKGSDWDFLVIIKKRISFHEWSDIYANINKALIKKDMATDILIRTEREFKKYRNCIGDISYYGNRDGIII